MLRAKVGGWLALLGLLAATGTAAGNDFLSDRTSDWFRYRNARTQQEVTSQISLTSGSWRLWRSFAGLGDVWVYTYPTSDWFWLYLGGSAQMMPAPSAPVGTTRTVDLGALNRGAVRVAEVGATLATPAGTFRDVSRLDLTTSAADAGVTSIWFAKGVGVVKWSEQSIMGPVDWELSAAQVAGQSYPQTQPTVPAGRARAPEEHAAIERVLWGCNDTYLVLDTYADAFTGLAGRGVLSEVAVTSNQVASQLRYEMVQQGVPLDDVDFLVVALDSVWMRDYGPIILRDPATGERSVADMNYYPGRTRDDRFPAAYATYRGWPRVRVDISYEGGNFATDGRGQGMASQGVLWFNQGKTRSAILREFAKLGCDQVEFFEPLEDEGTTHIDMFARVMTDRDALVSRYPSGHRQARIVNDAAAKMQALGYRVTRVDADSSYDEYATYANSVLVNGVALIPTYSSSSRNRAALDAYRSLGFEPVSIDSRMIIRYGGATHCLSMQVPR